MSLSQDTRRWLAKTVADALEARDQHCEVIVTKAITKHNETSAAHNPVKAITLLGVILGVWEGIRKFFSH